MAHPVFALLKKNAILKRSRWVGLLVELALPLVFVGLATMLLSKTEKTINKTKEMGEKADPTHRNFDNKVGQGRIHMLKPDFWQPFGFNPVEWKDDIQALPGDRFNTYSYRSDHSPESLLLFMSELKKLTQEDKDRLGDHVKGREYGVNGFIDFKDGKGDEVKLQLQDGNDRLIPTAIFYIVNAIINKLGGGPSGVPNPVGMVIGKFVDERGAAEDFSLEVALIVMLLFAFSVTYLSTTIVEERQLRLREVMKIQGVREWHFYLSWFLTYGAVYLFQATGVSIILVMCTFKEYSFVILLLGIFLFLLACAAITLSITSLFDSPRTGNMIAMGIMLIVSIAGWAFSMEKSPSHQLAPMLLPTFAFRHFMAALGRAISQGDNVSLGSLFKTVDMHLNAGYALVMLIIDIVIYNLLYHYVERVVPHEFGRTLPWYFPFSQEYWTGNTKKEAVDNSLPTGIADDLIFESFTAREQQLIADNAVADFQHMTKVFKTDGVTLKAVDDVSLTMFPSEILCLLGANSAGKTTLTSMLLGLVDSTAGQGRVLGLDMDKEQAKVRRLTGYCPQQDVLWADLTVIQHMQLYGSIRGLSSVQARKQALNALNDSTFQSKAGTKVKNLSGGMKRKLCSMLAFMGNTKFVILDEPTTGLDPFSRRAMWDLLKSVKPGRIVCLTTHFMDEAELLGDRIAIMALGRLRAFGTQMFLKQAFGGGYQLRIARSSGSDERIIAALQSIVSTVEVESRTSAEIVARVPMEESAKLKDLFTEIDHRKTELSIDSYTVAGAKLEDVFLKIARSTLPDAVRHANEGVDEAIEEARKHRGPMLIGFQLAAMAMKRIHMSYRSIQVFFFGFLFPLALIIVGVELPRILDKWHYSKIEGLIEFNAADLRIAVIDATNVASFPACQELAELLKPMAKYTQADSLLSGLEFPSRITGEQDWLPIAKDIVIKTKSDRRLQAVVGVVACEAGATPVAGLFFVDSRRTSPKEKIAIQMEFMKRTMAFHRGVADEHLPKLKIDRRRWPGEPIGIMFTLLAVLLICKGFSFFGPVIGLFVANERLRGVKFQQLVSGLRVETYWIGTLLIDFVLFCLLALLAFVYMSISNSKYLDKSHFFAAAFSFSLGSMSLTYLVSRFTASPMGTFWVSLSLNSIPGMIGLFMAFFKTLSEIHKASGQQDVESIQRLYDGFNVGAFAFPAYHFFKAVCLSFISGNLGSMHSQVDTMLKGVDFNKLVAQQNKYCLLIGALHFLLVIILDFVWFNLLTRRAAPKETDADVATDAEAIPVLQTEGARLLQIQDVRKSFGSLRAVNGVSFDTRAGEVFGLLGTNSAGKSTTVKIAVGELGPDAGHVYMDGMHVHSNLQDVRKKFGYCAQHDALFEDLTVLEHLRFYAAIKGIPLKDAHTEIERVVNVLGLTSFVNTRAGRLSGGNKRKLSLAMAAIGGPAVLFLDEPSSGMDPLSQRFMWSIIKRLANARRTIVLTTHSMEEAEAVSDRVGIMMTGQFKCIGTLQEIKSTYGRGFEIVIQAAAPGMAALAAIRSTLSQNYGLNLQEEESVVPRHVCLRICRDKSVLLQEEFEHEFPNSTDDLSADVFIEWLAENDASDAVDNFLKTKLVSEKLTRVESVGLMQRYLLTRVSNLSSIFNCLEEAKAQGVSGEYSLTQFSLEQIFNNFAQEDQGRRQVKDVASVDSDTD